MLKNRLKYIRMREYEMTQKEFAELLGIHQVTYNGYENGNTYPSALVLFQMAKKLNKTVDEIFYLTK